MAGPMAGVPNPWVGAIQQRQAQAVLPQAAGVFRSIGPGGAQFADIIENDPRAAAGIAHQFGGFQALHAELTKSAMAGAQQANAGVGRDYTNVLAGLPDVIDSPQAMSRAQNLLAMGGIPTSQWSAILGERVLDPEKVQVGTQNQYIDQYRRRVEGLGGPMQAETVINMPAQPRKFGEINKMREAYNDAQADYVALARGLTKARAIQAANLDSPEANIDIVTLIAKAMDPNSVVREGEITMRLNNASVIRNLQRKYKQFTQNGGFLTQQDIQDIIDSMSVQLEAEEERARRVEESYVNYIGSENEDALRFVMPETLDQMRERAFDDALTDEEEENWVPSRTENIGGATVEWE